MNVTDYTYYIYNLNYITNNISLIINYLIIIYSNIPKIISIWISHNSTYLENLFYPNLTDLIDYNAHFNVHRCKSNSVNN